jgi:arylsulfatase A-like enzyme
VGAWDNTLIIFTSDHGEQMGDHWLYGKAGFFDQSYHIPMIVRAPGSDGSTGARVRAFSEHVDVMPTMLEWAHLDVPRQCDGRPLQPLLRGAVPADWRTEAHWEYDFRDSGFDAALGLTMETSSLNVIRGATTKYVHFADLPPLLFDLETDPGEFIDRSADDKYQQRLADFARRLLSWRMRHTDKTLSHIQVTQEAGLVVRGSA